MKLKLIFPPEIIEAFVIMRHLGYGRGKNFCCDNLSLTEIEISDLERKLKDDFKENYFAFGRWYANNRVLTEKQNEQLLSDYQNEFKKFNLDEFTQKKDWFSNSFGDKIIIDEKSEFLVFFNILDFYDHAFNWPYKDDYIISISPRINGEFGWSSLRHEILHIILKKKSNFTVNDQLLKIFAPKGYENEEHRIILDEIMVLSLNLLFLPDDKIIKLLSFYDTIGYDIVRAAYDITKEFSLPIDINFNFQKNWFDKLRKKLSDIKNA